MKKLMLLVIVMLIVWPTFAQIQAPAPEELELVFFPDNTYKTIWVYERQMSNDLKFKKKVLIPAEIQKNGSSVEIITNYLNKGSDSFPLKTTFLNSSVIPGGKWYLPKDLKSEYKTEGFNLNRETLTFEKFSVSDFKIVNSMQFKSMLNFIAIIGLGCFAFSIIFYWIFIKMNFKKRMILSSFANIVLLILGDTKLFKMGYVNIPIVIVFTILSAVLIFHIFYFEEAEINKTKEINKNKTLKDLPINMH